MEQSPKSNGFIERIMGFQREDWVFLIWRFGFIIFVVFIYFTVNYFFKDPSFEKVTELFATAFVVPSALSALEKFGTFIPIENRIKKIYNNLQNQIASINDNISTIIHNFISKQNEDQKVHLSMLKEQTSILRKNTEMLQNYTKYQSSRMRYGFVEIHGRQQNEALPHQSKEIPLVVLNKASAGDKVFYMTTYIPNHPVYVHAINDAISRGVSIQLLLMAPSIDAPVVQARLYDMKNPADMLGQNKQENLRHFVDELKVCARPFMAIRKKFRESEHQLKGSFDMSFYSKSLNFPLVCIEYSNKSPEAYTGFYAGMSAEEMPYIEWQDGDISIYNKFKQVFAKKWHACSAEGESNFPI